MAERVVVDVVPSPHVTVTGSPAVPPELLPLATRLEPSSTNEESRFMVSTLVEPGGGAEPVQPPVSEVVRRALKVSCSASSMVAAVAPPPLASSPGSAPVTVTVVPMVCTSNAVSPTEPFG